MIISFPFLIQAQEYEVSNLNLKVDINEDFIVFTRDNLEDNQALLDLDITKEYMESNMINNSIYLDIIKDDLSYEILVVVPDKPTIFDNLKNASEEALSGLEDALAIQTKAEVTNVSLGNNIYVVLDYYDDNSHNYIVNYYTVVNSKGYNFQMQKKSQFTLEEKEEFKEIINSVDIKDLNEGKEPKKEEKKPINNSKLNINTKNMILGAIIGAVAGLITYLIIFIIKKRKSSK